MRYLQMGRMVANYVAGTKVWLVERHERTRCSAPRVAADAPPPPGDLSTNRRAFLAALHQKWPELAENVWLVHEFSRVLSQDDPAELEAWVALTSEATVMPEIKQFAKNLRQDWEAVVEAVRQPCVRVGCCCVVASG
jgi:transposase